MKSVGVMHLVDSLIPGGRERVAVNLVNSLPRQRYVPYLCTTRYDGGLANLVASDVRRLRLGRAFRYDLRGVLRLIRFVQKQNIRILHAHDASVFLAAIAACFPPRPVVIWHDHFGSYAVAERPAWLYRPAVKRASGVICVNEPLVEWSRSRLGFPKDRIWYVPNFVCRPNVIGTIPTLPGKRGQRIVCLANLRAQKDHVTLLKAMRIVVGQVPTAYLLLVGGTSEPECKQRIEMMIQREGLSGNVFLLGERSDVSAILKSCDIGVLSSVSEGLPLALLEYGLASLPAVATDVGQCKEVLDGGNSGMLVPVGASGQLADALLTLLKSPEIRSTLGHKLHSRVQAFYSPEAVLNRICHVYETALVPG